MKLALFSVMSLVLLMIIPVHADVNNATLDKETFTIDDKFTISGTVSDSERVMMVAAMKGPNGEKLNKNILSDPDGTFSFIPVDAGLLFSSKGEYKITIITENQRVENGTVIKIQYEKGIATVLPNYELILKENGNKNVDETKKLTFTASVTDSSIKDLEYSLSNHPNGATIDKDSGIFTWTPTNSQSGNYILDIVVKSGILEDRETITITVNDKPESSPEPAPEPLPPLPEPLPPAPACPLPCPGVNESSLVGPCPLLSPSSPSSLFPFDELPPPTPELNAPPPPLPEDPGTLTTVKGTPYLVR